MLDPPHREVDYPAVAEQLGLPVTDTRLKLGFPAPEVVAATEEEGARAFGEALRAAGVSVTVIDGRELAAIPWPRLVTRFEFGPDALVGVCGDETFRVRYDTHVTGVYWKPPPGFPAGGPDSLDPIPVPQEAHGAALADAIQWSAGLDLFYSDGGALSRLTLARDATDWRGLGELHGTSPTLNLETSVSEFARRFRSRVIDTRLENVRPRRRFVVGATGFDLDLRKGFSYGTLLLRQALAAVSDDLGDLSQFELGSRVAYVLNVHRIRSIPG